MKRLSSKAGVALKVLFGAAIFAAMVWSGKLDLAQVVSTLTQWPIILAMLTVSYLQVGIASLRWRLLLRAQGVSLPFGQIWGLSMIGMLFSVVIPGTVGGDLIKGYYVMRASADRKSHAATSILMDRVTGLVGLLFIGAVAAIANPAETMRTPATRSLALLAIGGFLAGLAGLGVAVMAGARLSTVGFLPQFLRNVFDALGEYRSNSSAIPMALALSVLNQTLSCLMYYLPLSATGIPGMPLSQFCLIVPLGFVAMSIPISPAGLGVGQAAFFALFQIVAPQYASLGSSALTVYQVVVILVCCSGLYWYIAYKHQDPEAIAAGTS